MGLGKTIEALAYLKLNGGKALVLCPSNVLYKWQAECDKWMGDNKASVIPTGKTELPNTPIHIMTYGIFTSKYGELLRKPYDVLIADEAHYLKNPKAQRTRAVNKFIRGGIKKILFLSGTPFMNRPMELFTLLNMLRPAQFPSFYSFATRYCGASVDGGAWYFPKNTLTNGDELALRVQHVMLRRTKGEVGIELPPILRTSIPVATSNKGEYNKTRSEFKRWYANGKRSNASTLVQLTALRRVVGMGKIKPAVELAENILEGEQKVVLFCHHKEVASIITEKLSKNYKVGVITGATPPKTRQKLADQFKDSNETLMFKDQLCVIIMTTAGIEGIDLYSASHIIFVEREWVPALEEQAEARLHRIGQENKVTSHYLVAKGTVDEKLDRYVREKRDIVKQVVPQDEILEVVLEGIL